MEAIISDDVRAIEADLIAFRRELHRVPETAFNEKRTASKIVRELEAAGLAVKQGIGGTGVMAVMEGGAPGPTLMIRADIDGLPIEERTGLPFASTNGAMHACGHDSHITMATGAARVLAGEREQLRGRVVFVFQPAEEVVQGALAMIADGALEEPRPDRVIGLHVWNGLELGQVGVNKGTVFASADAIRITVKGRGGHGALPHLTVDPVVAGAEVVAALQTVVSREIAPDEMGVLTFGQVHAGSAPNVIADSLTLEGTVRAHRPEVRTAILAAAERVAKGVAGAMRADAEFELLYGSPPVVNDPRVAEFMARHAAGVVGEEGVGEALPLSVGDDMAEFLNRVPGCYFLLGAKREGTEGHHNARFDFDERCLPIGTEIFVRAAREFLS